MCEHLTEDYPVNGEVSGSSAHSWHSHPCKRRSFELNKKDQERKPHSDQVRVCLLSPAS